ncbi:hypothetical protein FEM48_Zijuj03G0109500 [Ziziphus jujuba var. spinosa]|uniref:Uncharacterized protein n=1 Tax=Ziziphus jujuba var. spinosa TaxID=714518 RepID=A0A978VPW9_ZIZJJ|nr:hypothetical protein FEM48_Zijuj03G0109500 [Ziziphus jujuba var. spinosa]
MKLLISHSNKKILNRKFWKCINNKVNIQNYILYCVTKVMDQLFINYMNVMHGGKYCEKFVWDDKIHCICGNINKMKIEMLINEMASLNNNVRELNSNVKVLHKIFTENQQHQRKREYDWGLLSVIVIATISICCFYKNM